MMLIDLLDLYAYQHDSNDLFLLLNDYTIDNRITRESLNKIILKELGNARPFSNNTTIFKFALEEFFDKYSYNITKLIDTMYLEYNPLYTKDITRDLAEDIGVDNTEVNNYTKTKNDTRTEQRDSTGDINNTDTNTTNKTGTETDDRTDTTTVSAYDSPSYQPKQKVTIDDDKTYGENSTSTGETTSHIVSDVDTTETTNTTDNEIDNLRRDTDTDRDVLEHIKGKDGNITYQELIKQERELAEFNIYDWIIKLMRKELFLLVY